MKNEQKHVSKENIKKILEQIPDKDIEKTILQIPKEVLEQISEEDIKKAAHQIPKEDIEKVMSNIPQKDIKKISKIEEVTPDTLEQLSAGIGSQTKKSLKYLGAAAILIAATATSYAVGNFKGKKRGETVGYASGFNKGRAKGYTSGFDQGHVQGLREGYDKGHAIGLEEGHDAGYNEKIGTIFKGSMNIVQTIAMYACATGMCAAKEIYCPPPKNDVETITLP